MQPKASLQEVGGSSWLVNPRGTSINTHSTFHQPAASPAPCLSPGRRGWPALLTVKEQKRSTCQRGAARGSDDPSLSVTEPLSKDPIPSAPGQPLQRLRCLQLFMRRSKKLQVAGTQPVSVNARRGFLSTFVHTSFPPPTPPAGTSSAQIRDEAVKAQGPQQRGRGARGPRVTNCRGWALSTRQPLQVPCSRP